VRFQVLTAMNMKTIAFWDIARVVSLKYTDFSEAHTVSIIRAAIIGLMINAVPISETSVYFNDITWRYIPEGSNLHCLN
jgi:hypothetical protein